MEKHPVVAHAIMESVSDPVDHSKIQTIKNDDGLWYLKFPAVLQRFNKLNRNGRTYTKEPMVQGLHDTNVQELISRNSWLGEADHPINPIAKRSSSIERIVTIMLKNTSHRINSFSVDGDILHGEIETLDNDGYGNMMTKMLLQRLEAAFSVRALVNLIKRPDGTSIIKTKPRIVTYDWVVFPSHPEAYMDKGAPSLINQKYGENVSVTESGIIVPVMESALEFLKEESTNLKLISDQMEVSLESATMSDTGDYVYLKDEGVKYAVPVESFAHAQVRSYLSKL